MDKELSHIPVYTPYVTSYRRRKVAGGVEESAPTLKRYYSSIDAEVYFGNEFVEEVSDLRWSIEQYVLPIKGFQSYTADAIVQGARLITGAFTIRFITPNYLFKILEVASEETLLEKAIYRTQEKERNVLFPKGDTDHTYGGTIVGTNSSPLWTPTFDIDVIYGKQNPMGEEMHLIIEGVKISSATSNVSSDSPMPISETYQFIARDIKTFV